jgi:hypothetical protein
MSFISTSYLESRQQPYAQNMALLGFSGLLDTKKPKSDPT